MKSNKLCYYVIFITMLLKSLFIFLYKFFFIGSIHNNWPTITIWCSNIIVFFRIYMNRYFFFDKQICYFLMPALMNILFRDYIFIIFVDLHIIFFTFYLLYI